MRHVDQFRSALSNYLPGLLALFDFADAKRRNNHLGHQAVDRDIEELGRLIHDSIGDSGLMQRIAGDKWLALYKTDSLAPVIALLSAFRREQQFLLGWECTGDKDGITKRAERTTRATIVRAARCLYAFTSDSRDPLALIDRLLEQNYGLPPDVPHSLADAEKTKKSGWSCVTAYPAESPFCPFCEQRNFYWEDGDGSVYSGNGTCKACGASIDIRGIEKFP